MVLSGTDSLLDDYVYTYDGNRNIKQVTDKVTNSTQSFTYDSLNQLISETTPSGSTITYTYDKLGNRTSMVDSVNGTTTYGYNAEGNRLTSITSGGTTSSVLYDNNGQMTQNGSSLYSWNVEHQLTQATANGQTHNYGYDPLGRRVTIDGQYVGYVGNSTQVGYMTDSSDNLTKSWVYNSAGLPVLMHILFNGAFHDYGYLYDGQGRITGLVDESTKQSVVTYTYDAWGNVSYTENPTGLGLAQQNPFVYHGYWYDWNTGLYYLNARYYNPAIGRFLSEDPVGAKTGDVLSYNGYTYAGNNPVNNVDPNGTAPKRGTTFADHLRNAWYDVASWLLNAANTIGGFGLPSPGKLFDGEVMSPSQAAKDIYNAERKGTALTKSDAAHRSGSFLSEGQLATGKTFKVIGGDGVQYTLLQVKGALNGEDGIFEYILGPDGKVSHQRFIPGGVVNGIINQK